jgi:hypothetical protein
MPHDLAPTFAVTVNREAAELHRVTEAEATTRPSPGAWSRKEELGHLIDSAANNHVRFVQGSLLPEYRSLSYDQCGWVERHGYHDMPWNDLVEFWSRYNHLLAVVIQRIPEDRLATPVTIGNGRPATLRFVIEDYILHMQHHLDHILRREKITQYPPVASTA